jgi:hypothetical protein
MADLATVAAVRQYLGIESSEADEELGIYLSAASARFVRETGRTFAAAPRTEVFSGEFIGGAGQFGVLGTTRILNASPVASVQSVKVDGETIPQRPAVGSSGWVLDGDRIVLDGYWFNSGILNCEITYTPALADVPADVFLAVVELAALHYKYKDRVGIMNSSQAGETTTFQTLTLPESVRSVIDLYREWRIR